MLYDINKNLIPFREADTSWKQAATIAMFGMKLRQSGYASHISWKSVLNTAYSCFSRENSMGNEFLTLLERAKVIYRHKRK
jgi:hypothetical protein